MEKLALRLTYAWMSWDRDKQIRSVQQSTIIFA